MYSKCIHLWVDGFGQIGVCDSMLFCCGCLLAECLALAPLFGFGQVWQIESLDSFGKSIQGVDSGWKDPALFRPFLSVGEIG